MKRICHFLLAAAASSQMATAQSVGDTVRFISCPIYRDTDAGRKSGCWLADDRESGERFDVTFSPTKPDWNYEVLVEGRTTAANEKACGGVVLDPVRVSVLTGACPRHMLPAEGFAGHPFVLPTRNVRPLSEAREIPSPPYKQIDFYLLFDFNRDFIVYQLDDYLLDQTITFIRAANPKRIEVTGYAATEPAQVSDRALAEKPEMARRRAELISEALLRLGVPAERIHTDWKTGADPIGAPGADGLDEPSRRRVRIRVIP